MAVLPVTNTRSGAAPSASRLSRAAAVGAKWYPLMRLTARRANSSGQGLSMS